MKRFIKKVTVATGLDAFFVRRSDAAIILGLHQVEEYDGSMLSQRVAPISSNTFDGILRYLQSLKYSFVSLGEIVNGSSCSKKAAITFDDGFRSVYANAFPILRKYKAPFTIFLTTATLGANRLLWLHRLYAAVDLLRQANTYNVMERFSFRAQRGYSLKDVLGNMVCRGNPDELSLFANELAAQAGLTVADETRLAKRLYLTPNEVMEMMQGGMTVGAHGHEHWCLETLDQSQTETEIVLCKEKIEKTFGISVEHYALSYGRTNNYVKSILEQHGFTSLSTAEAGLVRTNTNPYALPRLMASDVPDLAGQIMRQYAQQLFVGVKKRILLND